jgi:hypothetical protein
MPASFKIPSLIFLVLRGGVVCFTTWPPSLVGDTSTKLPSNTMALTSIWMKGKAILSHRTIAVGPHLTWFAAGFTGNEFTDSTTSLAIHFCIAFRWFWFATAKIAKDRPAPLTSSTVAIVDRGTGGTAVSTSICFARSATHFGGKNPVLPIRTINNR